MFGSWASQKVMATYRRVYGFGHLRADCQGPGSALEPYAHFQYGTTYLPTYTRLGRVPQRHPNESLQGLL